MLWLKLSSLAHHSELPLYKGYLCFECEVMVYLKLCFNGEYCWKPEEMSSWGCILVKTKVEIAKSAVSKYAWQTCFCFLALVPFSKCFGRNDKVHISDFIQFSSAYF